jgi:hypothetical protein
MEAEVGGTEMRAHSASLTVRDRLQVAAFKSIFNSNPDLRPELRLVHAIVATCDDALNNFGKETLIQEWIQTYDRDDRYVREM